MRRISFLAGCAAATILPLPAFATSLHAAVESAAAQSSGKVAVYARAMNGKPPLVAYHDREVFPAASTIKLLIMLCAFRYAEQSDPHFFNRKIILRASDMVGGSEFLAYSQAGQHFTAGTLIRAMITVSDNTASNALITTLGFDRIKRTAARIGLEQTHLRRHYLDTFATVRHMENVTSARDLGMLLYELERGAREGVTTIASPRSCRRMIDILLQQEDREKIAQGLPHGTPLANKTGEVTGVRSDAGIIDPFGDVPYVLAILTKDLDDYGAGTNAIIRITRRVNLAIDVTSREALRP
jgi:beta-lactamase class A